MKTLIFHFYLSLHRYVQDIKSKERIHKSREGRIGGALPCFCHSGTAKNSQELGFTGTTIIRAWVEANEA